MIRIVEVGPRDGLQNEPALVPTATKVAFVDALSECGLSEIEVSSFVSPKWVPQLADAEEVFARIRRNRGVVYSALVPNVQGLERAIAAKVGKIGVFTAASESFTEKNINTSIAGSFRRFAPVVPRAKSANILVRGYVSTAFWCPYEGKTAPARAIGVIRQLFAAGVDEVSIGDTIGKATPADVRDLLEPLLAEVSAEKLALHFHDTYGNAKDNVLAAYELGIIAFDASVGGLGGCPYAPGAKGNVATELVITTLRKAGADVPGDLQKLAAARAILGDLKHAR